MCGVAGIISRNNKNYEDSLRSMLSSIAHRGPDDEQIYFKTIENTQILLGHRRLSIIDIEGGSQPFFDDRSEACIVFNGEIFNFSDLKTQLSKQHIFRSQSDTEVLLAHLNQSAESKLTELNGMFAFGYVNSHERYFLLARDRYGLKPLYFFFDPTQKLFAFCSELSGLMACPFIRKEIDQSALLSYLSLDYVPAPLSFISQVQKIRQGHYLKFNLDFSNFEFLPYFKFSKKPPQVSDSFELASEKTALFMKRAVNRQLTADVEVGLLLSGGLDSSAIAAYSAQDLSHPLRAFTFGFDDRTYDETGHAEKVAAFLKIPLISERLKEEDAINLVPHILRKLDEPLGDASFIATYLVSLLARRHVKVVLGGDGGDELFSGYATFKAEQLAHLMDWVPTKFFSVINRSLSFLPAKTDYQSLEWKIKSFFERYDRRLFHRHLSWLSPLSETEFKDLIATPTERETSWQLLLEDWAGSSINPDQLLDFYFSSYLSGSVLTKVDRASMACGLEVRPPFLDTELVEYVRSLPYVYKQKGKIQKRLLKNLLKGKLPEDIIHRKKHGFALPIARWLKGPLKPMLEQILADSPIWDLTPIRQRHVKVMSEQHYRGEKNHNKILWNLLVLHHWMLKSL